MSRKIVKKEGVETPKTETPKNVKLWDVIDNQGRLINIYEEKERAEILIGKNPTWKVEPSPEGRTRVDVENSQSEIKAGRLKELEGKYPASKVESIAISNIK